VPTRPPRTRTQPQERPLAAYANLRAPRPPDRHYNLYVPSPCFETTCHRYPLPDPPTTRCTRRPVATGPAARSDRRKSTIHVPRHSSSPILPPRSARRPRYAHMMGRPGATHLAVATRPPMVDVSPLRQQRPLLLLPHRDRLPALRQLRLRLGTIIKRVVGSTGFVVNDTPAATHHLEKVEGRATRRPFVLTTPARPQSPHARRQPISGGCPLSPNFKVPGYDGRAL
jgi:hypothetical protein